VLNVANAIEQGRYVARDIGGSDPERMSAPKVADYCRQTFASTGIKFEVLEDKAEIAKKFPCLGAVNRGSNDQHLARVIMLTYEPTDASKVKKTLGFVGKGVTFDTGGHDIKAGGIMAGMHRDKCGAAAVAGLFKTLSLLKPSSVRVIGKRSL
jgi:leucyl aminopeptidase